MKIIVLYILLFSLSANARENPFFPVDSAQDLSYTSNNINEVEPLKQATISLPNTARRIKKVTVEYQNLDGAIENKSIELDNEVDWHIPIFISQSYTTESNKNIHKKKPIVLKKYNFDFIQVAFSNKTISIKSGDKLLRNFILTNPQRIVLDFKRDANFLTYKKDVNSNIFKNLVIGNHQGYYRCVITLDGQYTHKITKSNNTLEIKLF